MIYFAEMGTPGVVLEEIQPSEQDPAKCAAMMAECLPELHGLPDRLRQDFQPLTLADFPEEYRHWLPDATEPPAAQDSPPEDGASPLQIRESVSIGNIYERRTRYTDRTRENTVASFLAEVNIQVSEESGVFPVGRAHIRRGHWRIIDEKKQPYDISLQYDFFSSGRVMLNGCAEEVSTHANNSMDNDWQTLRLSHFAPLPLVPENRQIVFREHQLGAVHVRALGDFLLKRHSTTRPIRYR